MHPQDQRQTARHPQSAPASSGDAVAVAPSHVSMQEHIALYSDYKKQDAVVQQLACENETNKERASKYKQSLKARLEDLKALQGKLDKCKARIKTLEADRELAKGAGGQAGTTKAKLEELESLKAELPQVKALLAKGGEAQRKVEALQKQLGELKVTTTTSGGSMHDPQWRVVTEGLEAKNQQLQSDAVAAKAMLKTASQEVSARISQLAACKAMLVKSEQVLRTCSDLHESKGDALASALHETTKNVEAFIRTL
jgi:chromosome segregation ATPase